MRVLITGHDGYIGTVLVPMFRAAGHDVVGLDNYLFRGCTFGPEADEPAALAKDVRHVTPDDLVGFDAVVHLAAISNDPLGDLNPDTTFDINHRATVQLAKAAKAAGVRRFLFSSSCSLYGAHGNEYLDEHAEFNPVTPYGESKVLSEQDLPCWPTTTSAPPICATRRPTGSLPDCEATWLSTTSPDLPSLPARCS